jgi:hypothetical protein
MSTGDNAHLYYTSYMSILGTLTQIRLETEGQDFILPRQVRLHFQYV